MRAIVLLSLLKAAPRFTTWCSGRIGLCDNDALLYLLT